MPAWTFTPAPTTAIVGVASTSYTTATTGAYVVAVSNGTVGASGTSGSFGILSTTQPGYLTGRRPAKGQLFPRGVYNK